MSIAAQTSSLEKLLAAIELESWCAYGGGWSDEISTALVDAVFSIRSTYRSDSPGKGVFGRLQTFRKTHGEATKSLPTLIDLGEETIRAIMGETRTGRRPKSEAVVEGATNLVNEGVQTAQDFRTTDRDRLKNAYTRVHGLGWITFEYFSMLLGVPGVKADMMICRFVNRALEADGLPPVGPSVARALVVEAYERSAAGDSTVGPVESLTHFEHGIWLTESNRSVARRAERR